MNDADSRRWQRRRADKDAAFALPLLAPGMAVVDVGCGSGSITLGLAARVDPGQTWGIDVDAARVDTAGRRAVATGVANAAFLVAEAMALPLPDAAVDVVFANGLVEHLDEPARTLAEFLRVLRPGGAIALRSPDWRAAIVEPADRALLRSIALRNRWQRHGGGDPTAGRRLKGLLAAAGLRDIAASAEADRDDRAQVRDYMHRILNDRELVRLAEENGWATAEELAEMATAWAAWAAQPAAFAAFFWCCATGRKR